MGKVARMRTASRLAGGGDERRRGRLIDAAMDGRAASERDTPPKSAYLALRGVEAPY
jgi:hypothetical protein